MLRDYTDVCELISNTPFLLERVIPFKFEENILHVGVANYGLIRFIGFHPFPANRFQ